MMFFSQINPYIRFARHMNLNSNSNFDRVVPLDARLFYATEGYGKINVKNKEYEMLPHSVIIINSGTPYHLVTPEKTVSYIALNFDFTQNAASDNIPVKPVDVNFFENKMLIDAVTFEDVPSLSEVIYIKELPGIQKKLTVIVREYTQKLLYHETKTGHILAQCLADCMRFNEIGNTASGKENANHILLYIHNNYHQNLSNKSIGEHFGYHPNYVSFLVKQLTGMPIHRYIIHVRLMNAALLLENTALSCDEIASSCGFYDIAYFSKYFKKHFGVTPSGYRSI